MKQTNTDCVILDKFALPPWTHWIVGLVALLLIVEKIGRSLVWLNDEEDREMMAIWSGSVKVFQGIWECFEGTLVGCPGYRSGLDSGVGLYFCLEILDFVAEKTGNDGYERRRDRKRRIDRYHFLRVAEFSNFGNDMILLGSKKQTCGNCR